jgi:tRNA (cytidine/uridine-2'-O-)-methyltransferase
MRIALYQPDIAQNTGAILRTAACLGVAVDLIGPAGFDASDRALRRAGLDYLDRVEIIRHVSFTAFQAARRAAAPPPRLVLLSTHAAVRHVDFAFCPDDILLFGRESAGVPDSVRQTADAQLRIPIAAGLRSLNLAAAVALTVGEALRQTRGFPA